MVLLTIKKTREDNSGELMSGKLPENDRPKISFSDLHMRANPYPTYALLRDHYPVFQIEPDGIWVVSNFKDVKFVLANHKLFSSSATAALYESEWLRDECKTTRLIITQDPPEHDKYSGLVKKLFVGGVIEYLIPLMRNTADLLLNDIQQNRSFDFVDCFAYPFVGTIVRDLMGIGEEQSLLELREWVTLEGSVMPTCPDEDFIAAYEVAILNQKKCFKNIIDKRRNSPKTDLVTHLINSEIDNKKLSEEQIIGLMCLLVQASLFTTVHMLGHAVITLSREPELASQLAASPSLIPNFIEELLRLSPSVLGVIRMTTQDVELSGVRIPNGDLIMPLLAAANRDALYFRDADTLDLYRKRISHHLTFGNSGAHTCIGAALARTELKIALEVLLGRYSKFVCADESQWVWEDSIFVRGVSKLPVRFG